MMTVLVSDGSLLLFGQRTFTPNLLPILLGALSVRTGAVRGTANRSTILRARTLEVDIP
jgi:hypothetical protein